MVGKYLHDVAVRAKRCSATHEMFADRTRLHALIDRDGIPTGHVFSERGLVQFWQDTSRFAGTLEPGWKVMTVSAEAERWEAHERYDGTWTVAHDGVPVDSPAMPELGKADAGLLASRLNAKQASPHHLLDVAASGPTPTAMMHLVEVMEN